MRADAADHNGHARQGREVAGRDRPLQLAGAPWTQGADPGGSAGYPVSARPHRHHGGAQGEASDRAINPNASIPAIVDHASPDGGEPLTVIESGTVTLHLAGTAGRLISADPRRRIEVLQWLFWQVGGLGPMMGPARHFFRYAPQPVPYAIERYQNETLRRQVLETTCGATVCRG